MQSRNKNILLVGGLGCGLLFTWLVIGFIIYIVRVRPSSLQTPPRLAPASMTTSTPMSNSDLQETEPVLPAALPTPAEIISLTQIPSPLPDFFDDSPPTGKIAFACYIEQIDQICLMNADGTNRTQLTDFDATAFYPSISPDGTTIYFSAKQPSEFDIYSISVDGGKATKLTNGIGSLYAPELSPNGEWIIFTNNGNGLWLMRPDGKNPHPLTNRDDIDPTWSSDGSMIAFASSRAGARQLFVMNADGTTIRQATNLDFMGGRSSFSPDGTKLTFYRGPAGDHNIYVINIDGTGLVQLTNGGDNLGPSWSPDGNWVAFTSFRDGNNEIYIIHPDGTGLTRLTNNLISDWQPRWGR